jgi:hypothetical protein
MKLVVMYKVWIIQAYNSHTRSNVAEMSKKVPVQKCLLSNEVASKSLHITDALCQKNKFRVRKYITFHTI